MRRSSGVAGLLLPVATAVAADGTRRRTRGQQRRRQPRERGFATGVLRKGNLAPSSKRLGKSATCWSPVQTKTTTKGFELTFVSIKLSFMYYVEIPLKIARNPLLPSCTD